MRQDLPAHPGPPHCPPSADLFEEALGSVLATVDMGEVLQRIGALIRRHYGPTRVAIHRCLPEAPGWAETLTADDPLGAGGSGTRFRLEGSLAGAALASGEPVFAERLGLGAPRWSEEALLAPRGYGSAASFPLVVDGRALGALEIAHAPREGVFAGCACHAGQIARLLAIALSNSLMFDEVRRLARLLKRENAVLREEATRGGRRYVAESPAMRAVMEQARRVAATDTTVLIRGETGTGKEGLARAIHELSPRLAAPFVAVNLGALPEALVESELFGHEKGAFTGAAGRQIGKLELADGGTLFLDELGDVPLAVQVKLLRALEERAFTRLGGNQPVRVDVRILAATHRPLEEMVAAGAFRADLFYRLAVFPLVLPPLRARLEEIRPLARYFVARLAARLNRRPPRIPEAAFRQLEAHAWPGNVRELENLLERALILSPGEELEVPPLAAPLPPVAAHRGEKTFEARMREILVEALAASGGRIYGPEGAAARLGLPPTTLQAKLRKHGLKRPERPDARRHAR
ncbi:MAG: sigma 54-interacting transcriptional regulator [Acidobacteria bacterium]|nr:sigma 54-interacting transcriptional regulator [Acidobacteriota bacterium]